MSLNLDSDVDVCESCDVETKVEPELLVNHWVVKFADRPEEASEAAGNYKTIKAIDASTIVYDGWEAMYPMLCKDCVMLTFTAEGTVNMFEKLRKKGRVTINRFPSMTELSQWYVQTPRPEDLAENKIPREKAKLNEPHSRW